MGDGGVISFRFHDLFNDLRNSERDKDNPLIWFLHPEYRIPESELFLSGQLNCYILHGELISYKK